MSQVRAKYLTTADLARHLGLTVDSINNYVQRGVIPRSAIVQRGRKCRRLYLVESVEKAMGGRPC